MPLKIEAAPPRIVTMLITSGELRLSGPRRGSISCVNDRPEQLLRQRHRQLVVSNLGTAAAFVGSRSIEPGRSTTFQVRPGEKLLLIAGLLSEAQKGTAHLDWFIQELRLEPMVKITEEDTDADSRPTSSSSVPCPAATDE